MQTKAEVWTHLIEAEEGSGSVGRQFAGVMRRSAEERRISESSSGLNHLEELASVHSTHCRAVAQLCSRSGYCFAHFFDYEFSLRSYVFAITLEA